MGLTNIRINGLSNPAGIGMDDNRVTFETVGIRGRKMKEGYAVIRRPGDKTVIDTIRIKEPTFFYLRKEVMEKLSPLSEYELKITLVDEKNNRYEEETTFITSRLERPWDACWIATVKETVNHPVFTKQFSAEKGKALLTVSGLGLFEAYLNGRKIGDEYLTPYLTAYDREIEYFTYEIELSDINTLEIVCGNGWYKGRFGLQGQNAYYGNRFACIAEIYQKNHLILKTDESFKARDSFVRFSGIYDGEEIDRTTDTGILYDTERVEGIAPLIDRISLPVKAKEILPARELIITPKGETVLDFGQNHAGFFSFRSRLKKSEKAEFTFGEVLQDGAFYNDNYREAHSHFTYISDGTDEEVRPHFTFFGFRYVKVEGIPAEKINLDDFRSEVLYSDLKQTGFIRTDNEKINRLFLNALWGQKSNFIDIPTDCPQRNERLGWTGDAQVFCPAATYNMDTIRFYGKFLHNLRSEQTDHDGLIGNYFPSMGDFTSSPIWGDAGVIIPYDMYRFYKDSEFVNQHYLLARDYVDSYEKRSENFIVTKAWTFGDWLALDGTGEESFKGSTDDTYLSTVYYYSSAEMLSKMAKVTGRTEDYKKYRTLARNIRKAILTHYFTRTGRLSVDTQTAYIVALKNGLYTDKKVLLDQFKKRLVNDSYRIKCGFAGAPVLCKTLADNGLTEDAYDFLFNESYPGWLYEVNMGATTIWERWNSMKEDGHTAKNAMNSFNHYAYGSVAEFMYENILGIRPETDGFGKVRIEPKATGKIRKMEGYYDSPHGKYAVKYEIQRNRVKFHVEIPFDAEAELILPGNDEIIPLSAGSYDYDYVPLHRLDLKYSLSTKLVKMKEDPKAMDVLKNNVPQLFGIIAENNGEFINSTLEEMKQCFFMGLNEKIIDDLMKKLEECK